MITRTFPAWMRALWPWLAAILSGVLLALAFAPWRQTWLIWIGLTPLLCAVWFTQAQKQRPFLLGLVAGVIYFTATLHWLSALADVVKAPMLIGIPLLLGSYCAVYVGVWAWFMRALAPPAEITARSSLRHLGIAALGASSWVALEWIRGWLLSGFGWNGLAVPLHSNIVMIQMVEITGVLGLSWLVAFCNVMTVLILRRILAELGPGFLKRIRWEFSATMLLVALVFGYGARKLTNPQSGPTAQLVVAAIQPNVPQDVKFDEKAEEAILEKLERLTTLAGTLKPDVILWPEAPAIRGMFADQMNYDFMMKLAQSGSWDLLFGSLDYEPDKKTPEEMRVYNSALLLREHGSVHASYRKLHLVPFGEYLPFRSIFPGFIGDLVPSDLSPGEKPEVFTLTNPAVRVAPLICFEDTLGDLTRQFCLEGAQVLVNLTNDGWFQHTVGAEQHLANAIFRAVETRRPLIRCANTGLTGMVDPLGRWEQWIAPFHEGWRRHPPIDYPTQPPITFYMRHGDWVGQLSAVLVIVWLLVPLALSRLRRGKTTPTG